MKKLVLLAGFLVLLTIAVISCNKNKSIAGTTWVSKVNGERDIFIFTTNTEFTYTRIYGKAVSDSGTYTYDAPTATIILLGESINAKVDKNELTLMFSGGLSRVFTKD